MRFLQFFGSSESSAGKPSETLSEVGPCLVFTDGIVAYRNRSAPSHVSLLDVAGGCCRTAVPSLSHVETKVRRVLNASESGHMKPVYRSVFVAMHSHSSSYYHVVAEVWPKLYYAREWLKDNKNVLVLHVIRVPALIEAFSMLLNIGPERFVMAKQEATLVDHAVVPHWVSEVSEPLHSMRRAVLSRVGRAIPSKPQRTSWLVLRREAGHSLKAERAMLNHDEMRHALRRVAPARVDLVEYPPAGLSILHTAKLWNEASVAIAPHGGGLTNLMFMPPQSVVIELIRADRHGRVYGALAREFDIKYFPCIYNESHADRATFNGSLGDSFFLDIDWFFERCLFPVVKPTLSATDAARMVLYRPKRSS